MSQAVQAAMPNEVVLGGAWIVEWDAIDPTTGASVSGVKVSLANVVGTDMAGSPTSGSGSGGDPGNNSGGGSVVGPFMLVPGPDA